MPKRELVSDDDILEALGWSRSGHRWCRAVKEPTDIVVDARRIESLVRKRLAERLRAEADRVSKYALSQAAGTLDGAARLVESDGGADEPE